MGLRDSGKEYRTGVTALLTVILLSGCAAAGGSDPVVDNSRTTQALANLPRHAGPKKIVTIYEFRSSVPEVQAGGATDMFTTALIKSGAFAVAERSRLSQGVMQEKQLNGSGVATGTSASSKISGADYIFEGTVSEANQSGSQNGGGVSWGGLSLGGGGNKDNIAIDVRIVDASSGLVIDSVDVHKDVSSTQASVAGLGSLIGNIAGRPVDANVQNGHRDGVDQATRACIETAVAELVKRYGGRLKCAVVFHVLPMLLASLLAPIAQSASALETAAPYDAAPATLNLLYADYGPQPLTAFTRGLTPGAWISTAQLVPSDLSINRMSYQTRYRLVFWHHANPARLRILAVDGDPAVDNAPRHELAVATALRFDGDPRFGQAYAAIIPPTPSSRPPMLVFEWTAGRSDLPEPTLVLIEDISTEDANRSPLMGRGRPPNLIPPQDRRGAAPASAASPEVSR